MVSGGDNTTGGRHDFADRWERRGARGDPVVRTGTVRTNVTCVGQVKRLCRITWICSATLLAEIEFSISRHKEPTITITVVGAGGDSGDFRRRWRAAHKIRRHYGSDPPADGWGRHSRQ